MKFDLIVVGAGPAGSMAAKAAAESGMKVAILEKRQEIGCPVRCAGGVSRWHLSRMIRPDPAWIDAEIKGSRVYSPDGTSITISENHEPDEVGFILDRKIFDRALAREAAQAGAEIFIKTSATGLLKRDGVPCGVHARSSGDMLDFKASLVIAADGIESKVGRWAGIDTTLKPADIEVCIEFLIQYSNIDADYCEFYLGNSIAPGGYVWSLPRGEDLINVGVCAQGSRHSPGMAMKLLSDFIKKNMPNAKVIEAVAGGVPACGRIKTTIADGVMLVGDAARQSDPFTYAGIVNGMRAGMMAGKAASEALERDDFSKAALKKYDDLWRSTIGKEIARDYRVKAFFTRLDDRDIDSIMHSLRNKDTSRADFGGLIGMVFRLNPRILLKARHAL